MKQAYLLLGLQKYSAKSKMRITQEKVYPIDVALMDQRDNALAGENLGWRLETIVYLQLVRTYKPQGYDIYYLSDRSGECDFVVCKNNQVKQAIQVSYDISSPKTRKREIEGLLLAHRKTQCADLLLLTDHEYNQVTEKGLDIKIRPVYDWVVEMGKRKIENRENNNRNIRNIGMFIAFIGLKNAGIITANADTFVQLGKFTPVSILGLISILLCGCLMARRVKGSLFIAIIISTLIGIPMGVTQFSDNWMPVSTPHSIAPIFCQFDFTGFFTPKMFMVVFSLLLVNIFDTIGTVLGLVSKLGVKENEKGEIPGVKEAMMSDAIGTTAGALLGSSTITTYVESASGVAEGGKSGLTSFFVGLMFILSIFLAPIFLLIPSAATSGALVMVGVLMIDSFKKIELEDISESFPAFITMITMVLCYSIADGICLGILSYVLIKMMVGKFKDLNLTLYILSIFLLFNYVFS